MSQITQNERVSNLTNYAIGLIEGVNGTELLKKYHILETDFIPKDILPVFDNLFKKYSDIEEIKTASNKIFNILYKTLQKHPSYDYPKNSILSLLTQDNIGVAKHLSIIKEDIKLLNKKADEEIINKLKESFTELSKFTQHYTVKENIIFPEIEKKWDDYDCIKVMWSFHDDIRRNIKKLTEILTVNDFDLQIFNQLSSKIYFNINTIIFREQFVLFSVIYETFDSKILEEMYHQLHEFNLAYAETENIKRNLNEVSTHDDILKLSTGEVSIAQLELILNHLTVDFTFIDENDKVRYFSDPKHRIFPRTTAIIGRSVQNCHPHESVETVNKIIHSFKTAEKDSASFWINMGEKLILIQYFAVRDKDKNYKGILEVSQEISEIQKLKGERRLLNW